jgi:ankyrin repeat protein
VPPVGSAAARAERARLDKERAETVRAEKERAEKARLEKTRPDKPRKRAAERWTALDYAAVRGDVQLVDVLMQHYQARGTQTLDVARSAVLLASRRNSPCYDFTPCEYSEGDIEPLTLEETMAEHLVKKGAPANFQDEYGVTCLHEAARNASERSCRALVDAGADLNAKTDTGLTPLHFAVAKGDAAVTKILLDAGADVNVQDADGATPLHLALRQKSEALLDLLLEKDANVELADKRGMSALHVAAEASDWDSTRRLLAEGAEVNRPDRIGRTPVLIAAENMKTNVSMLVAGLIDAGADVTVKDAKGRDAVEALTSQKDKAIREIGYLFQQGDAKDYVKFVQGELKKARAAAAPAPLEK